MNIAVVSDIHGNMEAFERVLADIHKQGIKHVISLGDNIGYGPEPEAVLRCIRERRILSIAGNHEIAAADPEGLRRFNPLAQESMRKTVQHLSQESLAHIRGLKKFRIVYGSRFVHGFPPDSPTIYLTHAGAAQIVREMQHLPERLCFVGHTHLLEMVAYDGNRINRSGLGRSKIRLKRGYKYVINAGSVGQPRDRDPRAKYLIWDGAERTLQARYIPYDIAVTVEKIAAMGFPKYHAQRLWTGR